VVAEILADLNYCIVVLCAIYFCQIVYTIVCLYFEEFNTKKQFVWWLVPFIPFIVVTVKQINNIGKKK